MMDNEEKFFTGIENTLHAYEEAYKPGAWDAFQQKRKRRRMAVLFTRIGSAAALLLLFSYVAVQFFAEVPQPVQVVKTKVDPQQPKVFQPQINSAPIITQPDNSSTEKNLPDNTADNLNTPIKKPVYPGNSVVPVTQDAPVVKPIFTDPGNVIAVNPDPVIKTGNGNLPVQKPMVVDSASGNLMSNVVVGTAIAQNQPKKTAPVTRSIYDSLFSSKNEKAVANLAKKNEKNLSYSVVLSPGMGNQKVNFNTGVEVAYKLNDNFSVSSGIGYSSLNAVSTGTSAIASRQGQQVNLAVSGVEVPVGVQYRTGAGYYVSAGIVGMQVTSNRLQYDYTTPVTMATASYNSLTGTTQDVFRVANEQKTEESKEKIKNVLGFYMLSIGQKKAVGKNQLNFGPFIRVPFGPVSSENIRLMQGGVRVGFGF